MDSLERIRKELGFTQEQAAKALNISRRAYQNHENNYLVDNDNSELERILKTYCVVSETTGYVTLRQIKDAVLKVVKSFSNIYAVYLFGSYARGDQTTFSDIDLLIVDDPIGFSDTKFMLRIKDILHKKIDVVSYREIVGDEEILKRLLKESIKIYG